MAADKLARGDAADLDQQVHLPVLALDGDFTAFIVAPCERDVGGAAKQPRDQEIVGYTTGNGAALQMRVGETGADCNPVARSHAGAGRRVCFRIRDLDDDAVRRRQNRPRDIRDAPDRHTQRMAKPDQKSQRKTAERQRDQSQQDRHAAAKRHDRPAFAGDPSTVGCVIHDRAVLHNVRR